MHLGNGAVTPGCAVFALGVAATGAGISLFAPRLLKTPMVHPRTAAIVGAIVFAAQMFNVAVLPYSSVHLIGGVLLAWVLGPPVGFLTMCAILAVQAIALGDGGLLTLGVNAINMGLLPALLVAMVGRRKVEPLSARSAGWLAATAFVSTFAGAALVVAEVAIGRATTLDLTRFATQMIGSHVVAGLFEAAATVAIVFLLVRLSHTRKERETPTTWTFSPAASATLIGLSLAVALLTAPALGLASPLPDAYEAAIASTSASIDEVSNPIAEQGLAVQAERWQETMIGAMPTTPGFVAICSTVIAGCMAAATAWFCAVIRRGEYPESCATA